MPILLKRKNGEITPFRNAEYISAFYFIPKSILDKCGEEINSIPRNPRKLLQDRRAIEIIESDLFKLVIIDAYAFMVWPFMGLGAKREIYSGYEPSWRYAHAASIWIKGMEDEGVIPKSQELLKSSNVYLPAFDTIPIALVCSIHLVGVITNLFNPASLLTASNCTRLKSGL